MRIVFIGSAEISCLSLDALIKSSAHDVVAVVTQPDKPKGRNLKVTSGVVKQLAEDAGVHVFSPANINDQDSIQTITDYQPDLIVVVAYGQILRSDILNLPPKGCVNIHTSLLPRYRGAAPIQYAVINGETETGVTSMYMDEGMDEGDMLLKQSVVIDESDTAGSLHDKLAEIGADLLMQTLKGIENGTVTAEPQDSSIATYAPKLSKKDGVVDWSLSAKEIYNMVRGMNPWPVCSCVINGKNVRIYSVQVEEMSGGVGEVLDLSDKGPIIGAGSGSVCLLEVQPEGKRIMTGKEFMLGHRLSVGDNIIKGI